MPQPRTNHRLRHRIEPEVHRPCMTRFAAIFEANRRKTLLTVIDRMLSSFFRSAVKFAAKSRSRAYLGIWPRRSLKQRLARAFNKRRPASTVGGATISFRCLGHSPPTPPALLGRNDFSATITSSSEKTTFVIPALLVTDASRGGRRVYDYCYYLSCGFDHNIIQ